MYKCLRSLPWKCLGKLCLKVLAWGLDGYKDKQNIKSHAFYRTSFFGKAAQKQLPKNKFS